MSDTSVLFSSIPVQREMLTTGKLSSKELTEMYISRIEDVDDKTGAFLTTSFAMARKQADEADKRIKDGDASPLLGIPIGIKDIICVEGVEATAASKILKGFMPPYNATVIENLLKAGAVFVGKLNMDEFAMGSSCENSAFHPTYNPYDLKRAPGGSSGGSAAAVAAGECAGALGTDTGGSIRQPASFCNVIGIKPTYGRVSRYGVMAFASSLDQVGVFARDTAGAASLLQVISGEDPHDSTSAPFNVPDFSSQLQTPIKGMKIGIPKEYFLKGLDSEIKNLVTTAIEELEKKHGAEIVEISLPHTEYAVSTYYLCCTAEASSNLARYDGAHYGYRAEHPESLTDMYVRSRTEGFGDEVKRRIMLGTFVLSAGYYDAYYNKALKVRRLIQQDFFNAFERVDCIAMPVSPIPPFEIGALVDDPLHMYLADIYTVTTSLAGLPGMSVPCGFTDPKDGVSALPVGMQLVGPPWEEQRLFQVAANYEKENSWGERVPSL